MRREWASSLPACAAMLAVLCASSAARAQTGRETGGMFEIPLPGGLRAALSAIDDRAQPDRSQFLYEIIRRVDRVFDPLNDEHRRARVHALLEQISSPDRSSNAASSTDVLPLPLPPGLWIKAVFDGRGAPDTLAGAILASRNASLLYCALLALDGPTRDWLADRPDLVAFLARRSAAFLVAAPGVRVTGGRLNLPGGPSADPAWGAIVGRTVDEPEAFIRSLVTGREGRAAYFLGALAQLTPPQQRVSLGLELPDAASRVTAAKRMYAVFEGVGAPWKIEQQPFWRPTLDPALLLAELPVNEGGAPRLPDATRAFWDAVLAEPSADSRRRRERDSDDPRADEPADVTFVCERVFAGPFALHRRRYNIVLFASRHIERVPPGLESDAIAAARAAGQYPALTAVVERAGVSDVEVFAAAARRAAKLEAIADRRCAIRAITQYQSALALVTRAALRGSLTPASLARLVSSLSSVDTSDHGDYEGRMVRWVAANLIVPFSDRQAHAAQTGAASVIDAATADPAEAALLRLLAGPAAAGAPLLDWEGTRYRVDLPAAEAMRLARVLTPDRPLLSAAVALVAIGDVFRSAAALDAADALMGKELADLAYAVAFGQPGAAVISPREAAARHDLSARPWWLPEPAYDEQRQWHMVGSLLGLDVRLASFSLVRLSLRQPLRRPSVNDIDRRVFSEVVTLVDPAALTDGDRDVIVAALAAGRSRIASMSSRSEAAAVADEIVLSPARRTLLEWALTHDRQSVPASFSLSELLWLGLGRQRPGVRLNAWGASAEPLLGCLCLRLLASPPADALAGRWSAGFRAGTFADLNLRLAELLAELRMPSALLGPLLSSATLDLVDNADSRDDDDRRGLIEFVRRINRERVEEYLALLTTDGPLVPVSDTAIQLPVP